MEPPPPRSRSRSPAAASCATSHAVAPVPQSERCSRSSSTCSDESSSSASLNSIVHFPWQAGMVMNSRYELQRLLGDGTFGRVVLARDTTGDREVAIKVIRDVKRYTEDARFEAAVLCKVREADPQGTSGCVAMYEAFMHDGRFFCMVFEPLGVSLYDFLKSNMYRGFWMQDIQSFAYQSMQALAFLHSQLCMTHTDLKPENILFESSEPPKQSPFPRECEGGSAASYMRPASSKIKFIDFGNATHEHERHSTLINTRQYRGPEVLLSLPWDHSSDLWSIGCILMECYAGDQLFETHEELEHLALVEQIIGEFPQRMIELTCEKVREEFFVRADGDQARWRLPWPERASSEPSRRHVARQRPLREHVLPGHASFVDFVASLLVMERKSRPRAINSLMHSFFASEFRD
eukprot:TRINITY_DN72582_c0_g1_i1.p1 TRINITY_DN72582_c0_g1~~TRINITY_DN72582_c0_g1_i1.p1  ORF type:complete len:407 (+),score=72.47 TRINITY_DN72582_c0_g1_i1:33-1253(+)